MSQKQKQRNRRGVRLNNALTKYERLEARGARPRAIRRLDIKIDRLKADYEARKKSR
jgi:hypothetical protein